MVTPPKEYLFPFLKKEQVAEDTYTFTFRRTDPEFSFTAGQYLRIFIDLPGIDPRGNSRMFSISSPPEQAEFLTITTKILPTPSLFKKTLFSLSDGEEVRIVAPLGTFTLPETNEHQIVLLAGGIGMTPFHSMLLSASNAAIEYAITCLASFKRQEDMVFYNELKTIEQQHPKLQTIYTLTQPSDQQDWSGPIGRISEELLRERVPQFNSALYYVCGPLAMVDAMMEMIKILNIPPEQIRKEKFTGY